MKVISFLLFFSQIAFANPVLDSIEDPFNSDDFTSAVTESIAQEEKNKLEYLLGTSFLSDSLFTLTEREVGGRTGVESKFSGKTFVKASKPSVGQLFVSASFEYYLFAAADNKNLQTYYRAISPDSTTLKLSLSELHLSFDLGKRVFVRVGNQIIGWGAGYFWSPTDFINREKAEAALLNPIDTRAGKPALRLHIPIKQANLFLFTDFSRVITPNSKEDISETIAQAYRFDIALKGVQWGTSGYLTKTNDIKTGFDATANLLGVDIYTEHAVTFLKENDGTKYALSIGGAKSFGTEKEWTLRGEFYFNREGLKETELSSLPRGTFIPFYSGKYYGFGELSTTKLFVNELSMALFGFMNIADRSYSANLQFRFNVPNIIPFTLYGRYYGGKQDREFTTLYRDRATQVGLRVALEF